jgi:4-amino-4-deoxy-L-arabinose transferase-like glycosyltransferase
LTEVTRTRAILAGIVAAGILIRIPGLLHDGLWRDEAYVYVDVIAPTFQAFLHRVVETEYHPPLYFLIAYGWLRLAGTSELSLKALPLLFSVLTIPAVYRLGRIAGSAATGLLAAAMYAVSPLAILESSDYLYPLMALLCTLLAAMVMAGRREKLRPVRLAAIAVVTMLTMYTQYAALFYVPMLAVWTLTSPRGVRHGLALTGALALGTLPFLVWLRTFLSQPNPYLLRSPWNPGNPLFVPPPGALDKLGFFAWTIVRSLPLWPEKLAIVLGLFLAAALVKLAMSRRINADAIAMGLIYAVALAIIAAAGRLGIRYIAPFIGLFYVFLAWIVAAWVERVRLERPSQWMQWGAAVTAVLCLFIVIEDAVFSMHTAGMPESGIRTFVRSQPLDPATLYVVAPDYMTATFAFYARDPHVAYTAFGQTDHPEIFRYGRDASIYSPGAVRNAIIALGKKAGGYEYLDLIVDDAGNSAKLSRGRLYRSPARRLLDSMRARYPLLGQRQYPGRLESVTVYRFRTQGYLRSAE